MVRQLGGIDRGKPVRQPGAGITFAEGLDANHRRADDFVVLDAHLISGAEQQFGPVAAALLLEGPADQLHVLACIADTPQTRLHELPPQPAFLTRVMDSAAPPVAPRCLPASCATRASRPRRAATRAERTMRASTAGTATLFGPLLADRMPGRDAGRERRMRVHGGRMSGLASRIGRPLPAWLCRQRSTKS